MAGPGRPPRHNRTPDMTAMEMMTNAMREQAQATANLVADLTRGTPAGSADTTGANAQVSGFSEFIKNLPPSFSGEYDPVAAEGWLQEIEGIFDVAPCTEENKVIHATFILKGEAKNWWKNTKERMVHQGTPLTWENFKEAFLDKYFPHNVRNQKEAEFLQLKQGNMTVGQYVAKFEELARFSRYLKNHPDEEWKSIKFE